MYRFEFSLTTAARRAKAYVSGVGYSELWVNGEKLGLGVLDPGWTDYSKRVFYVTHDLTRVLTNGANALAVLVSGGHYSEYWLGSFDGKHYPQRNKLLVQVDLELLNGTRLQILSDSSWKCSVSGPITGVHFFF
jgi:alpha-L-rhamnosidase